MKRGSGVSSEREYRYEATTVEGFVQQLAVSYLKNGYWLYVRNEIPAGKDPRAVDEKILVKYGIATSKWAKYRAKRRGEAKIQYLRYGSTFVILSTISKDGAHPLFQIEERSSIRDARKDPIYFYGYSVSYKDGHPHVRIATAQYREVTDAFLAVALSASACSLAAQFRSLPFEPYGPVKVQLKKLLFRVNWARKAAGLERVAAECLRTKRKTIRPFAEVDLPKPGSKGRAALTYTSNGNSTSCGRGE